MSVVQANDPATSNVSWMNEVCRRLGDALGCELSFHESSGAERAAAIPSSHIVWQSPVYHGEQVAGHLRLRTAEGESAATQPPQESSHPAHIAISAASVFAELLQRMVEMERQIVEVDRRSAELNEEEDALSGEESMPEMVARLLRKARRATNCWGTAFLLGHAMADQLRLRMCEGIPRELIAAPVRQWSKSPDRQAELQGLLVMSAEDPTAAPWLPNGCQSAIAVPIRSGEGSLGSLWCFDRRTRGWLITETRAAQNVAAELSRGLERSVLLRESELRRHMSRELTTASVKHPGQAMGTLSRRARLDVAIRTASPAELGGDLCEVWPLSDQRTLFAIGDATGHSVPGALIMAVARGSLRTLLGTDGNSLRSTSEICRCLNRALYSVTHGEQFMTFCCGIYDARSRILTYTNAGHPPPWHMRRGRAAPLESHGIVLGVMEDAQYETGELPLHNEDWLVAYSDGISEAQASDKSLFGAEGIRDTMCASNWESAEVALQAIWHAMSVHSEGRPAADDQTLLVLRST